MKLEYIASLFLSIANFSSFTQICIPFDFLKDLNSATSNSSLCASKVEKWVEFSYDNHIIDMYASALRELDWDIYRIIDLLLPINQIGVAKFLALNLCEDIPSLEAETKYMMDYQKEVCGHDEVSKILETLWKIVLKPFERETKLKKYSYQFKENGDTEQDSVHKLFDDNKMVKSTLLMGSLASFFKDVAHQPIYANISVINSPLPHPFFYLPIFAAILEIPALIQQLEKLDHFKISFKKESKLPFEVIEVATLNSNGEKFNLTGAIGKNQHFGYLIGVDGYIVDPPVKLRDQMTILRINSPVQDDWEVQEKFIIECRKVSYKITNLNLTGTSTSLITNYKGDEFHGLVITMRNRFCNPKLFKAKFNETKFYWTRGLPKLPPSK